MHIYKVPRNASPAHIEHLLNYLGPPPTVISFTPQPAFDIPGLASDPRRDPKAKMLATPLPRLIYSRELASAVRSLDIRLPDFFTWDQIRKVMEHQLNACDMWYNRDPESLSDPAKEREELDQFLQKSRHFSMTAIRFVTGITGDGPSLPLVSDLAAECGLQPIEKNPAFFGPGTLMLWPVMDLTDKMQMFKGDNLASQQDLHDLLAQVTIKTIKKHLHLDTYIKPGETGVWVNEQTTSESRRIATVRPILGPDSITSFGVGLQVGPLIKEASKVDRTMTSLAELGDILDILDTPADLAHHWVEEFAGVLAERAKIEIQRYQPGFKAKKAVIQAIEDSLVPKAPEWTIDHLEDHALGWRAQSPFDPSLEEPLVEPDEKRPRLTAGSPLHIVGKLFDSAGIEVPTYDNGKYGRYLKKLHLQTAKIKHALQTGSELAQGRPWLGVDKTMETWHEREIHRNNMLKLDLVALDHRAVILGNGAFPKLEPVPEKERITESDLIWPDLSVLKVKVDQEATYDLSSRQFYNHYGAWVLRVLRESSFGRQLDARLTDHSARYVAGEMLTNSAVALAVIKDADSSIAKGIKYGLNYIQRAAVYRRALMSVRKEPGEETAKLSRQEARLVLPYLRRLTGRQAKHRRLNRGFRSDYVGGLLPPEDFSETLERLVVRHPGQKKFSKNATEVIEARYGKEVLQATGLKKAPPNWRAKDDPFKRY
ncbi:hypothetical protein PspLS_08723 [Pyricularia sp. CBS 133598]|nr:hypothetical protein PspLS_08723 [Pyricularia sp. CBS 133598]